MPENLGKRRTRLFAKASRGRRRLPLSLFVLAVLIALFALVKPGRLPTGINPGSVSLPGPTIAPTFPPGPTDVHGGSIVFTCTRREVNQICSIRADGSGFQQLTTGESNSYYPGISRDGQQIIFAANQYDTFDLYRLAPDVVEGQRQSRSRLKRLTDYIGNAFSPSFSPDGSQVVFVNRVENHPAALWLMSNNGEDPHPIFSPPKDVVGAAWSPVGSKVALAVTGENAFAYDVFVLDMDKPLAAPRRIDSHLQDIGGSLSWSPDESNVLVFAGPAAAREVFRLDLATGNATQLTFGGNNAAPAYSPDGQYIVFNSLRNGGQADLYIMLANGHSTRQLTNDPQPDWQPQWGP